MTQLPKFSFTFFHPRYWFTWIGISTLWLLVKLPYPVIYRLGCAAGRLAQHLMKRRAHIAYRNLELCFPNMSRSDLQRMMKKHFESVGMGIMETGMAWFWSDARICRWYEVTGIGMDQIAELQEKKTGILLIGIHFLTLEIGARMFGLQAPGIGVYRTHNNPLIDWLQTWGRMRSNKSMINRKNLRAMVCALKKGEVVWYAPDHDYGPKESVFVPLFSVKETNTTIGTWILIKLAKSAIVPFVPRRKPRGKGYELMILEPELLPPLEDAKSTAHWMNSIIEKCILLAPEQYMWIHRRFKTRPGGVPSRY